jgi:hypothetical protein
MAMRRASSRVTIRWMRSEVRRLRICRQCGGQPWRFPASVAAAARSCSPGDLERRVALIAPVASYQMPPAPRFPAPRGTRSITVRDQDCEDANGSDLRDVSTTLTTWERGRPAAVLALATMSLTLTRSYSSHTWPSQCRRYPRKTSE